MSKAWPVSELLHDIEAHLTPAYDNPMLREQYAWWLLEAVTQKKEIILLTQQTITLTDNQRQQLAHWIEQLVQESKPLAYILGSVPFADLDIHVHPPILIPRPETEEWCIALINHLTKLSNQTLTILDMCTGTGCIALALAHALAQAHVYGSDIDKRAIALAQENATHNHITNATFITSDLFTTLAGSYDLIVSNPPYIPAKEWSTLDASVTKWENKDALLSGPDGLDIIRKIIEQAPAYLKPNQEMANAHIPQLMIEIDYTQAAAVTKLFKAAGYTAIHVHKDLEGKDRVVSARKG